MFSSSWGKKKQKLPWRVFSCFIFWGNIVSRRVLLQQRFLAEIYMLYLLHGTENVPSLGSISKFIRLFEGDSLNRFFANPRHPAKT